MMHYALTCRCHSVDLALALPNVIETYQARVCDCDFCRAHNLTYISDPNGTLGIKASVPLNHLKQGSNQASFVQCSKCEQVIAVTFASGKTIKGAVSASLFTSLHGHIKQVAASPKHLTPNEKRERWESLWLKVLIEQCGGK